MCVGILQIRAYQELTILNSWKYDFFVDSTVTITSNDLFFSKEAADYLGISVQRLNKLTKEGRIKPFKKNSSGTVYLKSELQNRRKELSIFEDSYSFYKEGECMFEINTPTKQEALNFSVLQSVLNESEKKLSIRFDAVESRLNLKAPLIEDLDSWSDEFSVSSESLSYAYEKALVSFQNLKSNDEIIGKDSCYYPEMLKQTDEAPRFLYLRGDKSLLLDKRAVALVGSRAASDTGQQNTARVARALGRNGVIIVSGLAKGIDASAHKAALEGNFKTIAVIGTSLNQYYPRENRSIQEEIEKKGLVVSQFSPAIKTERWFFPLRNGVMSGISLATVVMEAGETSGALIQARIALKQSRLVLIPKSALDIKTIDWPAKLVKKGATVVESPQEIINILGKANVYRSKPIEKNLFDINDDLYGYIAEKDVSY